ncbi:MAG: ribonuclease E/G [Bacteroidetes bacterium SW_7_64_58]|nr:MAG: ribonuclease E/G [Bacteroidetes bacterium SW_7_64_58]
MSKEIVFNVGTQQTRIAIVEDGKLAELYIENAEHKRTIGNLYLGRIRKVMPSIQAAFVDVGQEQDAFLHFSDLSDNLPYLLDFLGLEEPHVADIDVPKGRKDWDKRPSDILNRGQTILVQITKEPISNKGSRISTDISLAGRFLVLVPLQNYVAVSRKITNDDERRRLESLASSLVPDGVGVIVRTVAQDRDMASSIVRDEFSEEYNRILVDHEGLCHSIQSYVRAVAPQLVERVELHESGQPVFEAVGIQHGADRAFKDRVELPSGGYLFIEKTEAMHVVDVNSGRSGKGKSQAENSLNVNLEAARVIARQIRLRDLGGIIVVDFIDLYDEDDKKKVYDELKKGFEEDRAVTKVLPMSDFGLVEITRQRLRPSITTTFSSANGAPSDEEEDGEADTDALRQAEREIQRLEEEVKQREQEVERLKEEDNTPDEEVEALRQKIQSLESELEAARTQQQTTNETDAPASPEPPADLEDRATPDELVAEIEQWVVEHSDTHRAVTLRVHPFVAAFLRRPVPTHPTRWFMDHLVRVHLDDDADVPPHTFRVVDAQSGEPLPESP